MAIEKDVLDQLLAGRDPRDVFGKDGLVEELKKSLSERILNTELDEHLDGESAAGSVRHVIKTRMSEPTVQRVARVMCPGGKICCKVQEA